MGAPKNLTGLIDRRLTETGLSQREAARRIGVPSATFNRWVTGASVPAPDMVKPLARWLDMPAVKVTELADQARLRPRRYGAGTLARINDTYAAEVTKLREENRALARRVTALEEQLAELRERADT